jgi:hypothetical protein
MTLPANLLSKLQGIDIGGLLDLFKRARTTGRSVLEDLRERIRTHPELTTIHNDLERLLGPLFDGPSDEEIEASHQRWLSSFGQDVHDLPKFDPAPKPQPGPTEFPYGTVLNFHPLQMNEAALLKSGDKMYKMIAGAKYQVRRADDTTRPDPDVWEGLGLVP